MDSGEKEKKIFFEMVVALVSALYEKFSDVPPYSYMFLYGACSMSSFVVNRLEEIKEN